jgi:23S rRNA (adenine2503-C2)-methyltransferase
MKVLEKIGREDLACVYLAETVSGQHIEFVESIQPPYPREKKWVLIVSTLYGCPVACPICDAGRSYAGKLSRDEIMAQIDYMVESRYPDRKIPARKFKVQFARMGDPAFNLSVIEVIGELPRRYDAPGLMPCISTVAPAGTDKFFDRLLELKHGGESLCPDRWQMQFSIHSTDETTRDRMIPVRKWGFEKIASFGKNFFSPGDRKIALNFAMAEGIPVDVAELRLYFDPNIFLIKLTPVNPTVTAAENNVINSLHVGWSESAAGCLIDELKKHYEVIVSIGEREENKIGSNCGQYVHLYLNDNKTFLDYKPACPTEIRKWGE